MLKIAVQFKLAGDDTWRSFSVDPEAYFWHDPDDVGNHPWTVGSVSQHDNVAEILPIAATDVLEQARTRVTDLEVGDFEEHAYRFYRARSTWVCLATSRIGAKLSRELIIVGEMPFKPNGSQVLRVNLDDEVPNMSMNVFMWGPSGDDEELDVLHEKKQAGGMPPNKSLERTREE